MERLRFNVARLDMSLGFFARFRNRKNLLRIAGHSAWLFGDRALRAGLGLIVGAIVARHLGPDSFGILSLVFAYVLLFASIAGVGLDGIVIRDLVREPFNSPSILGTAFVIKFFCAAAIFVLGGALGHALDSGPDGLWALIAVGSCSLFFYSADVIDFRFQSQLNGRAIVMARSTAFVFASAVKLTLVAISAPLIIFAATPAIEAAVAAALLILIYASKEQSVRKWTFERRRAAILLKTAFPIAISGFFVIAIMQIDKLMLERITGAYAVGIYSAASLLSTAWYMVPVIVGSSVAPRLTRLHEDSQVEYARRLQDVFSALTFVALCVGAVIALLSKPLISLIFGDAYASAALILTIHVWTGVFIAHVSIRTRALLIEGKTKLILVFSGLTLLVNVLLNLVLIDRYAEAGAAWASLFSWGLNALLFPLGSGQSRGHVWFLLQSFIPASWMRAITR